jgi:hypothetical protein
MSYSGTNVISHVITFAESGTNFALIVMDSVTFLRLRQGDLANESRTFSLLSLSFDQLCSKVEARQKHRNQLSRSLSFIDLAIGSFLLPISHE